jgi:hypothetical protein
MSEGDWREDTVFNESVKSGQLITIIGEMVENR